MIKAIQTPLGEKTLHVCRDGVTGNEDWINVYEVSFPESQRQDLNDLRRQLSDGSMELDETRDQDENILCMTITEVFRANGGKEKQPEFLLACYTATVPAMRGLGIGSIHRRRLGELLETEYPNFLGIFSEIESTKEIGLDEETMKTRMRRKNFFLRLGLLPLDINYCIPSYLPGCQPIQAELLWVPFKTPKLDQSTLVAVLTKIYVEGYGLPPSSPFITAVLSQFTADAQMGRSN